MSDLKIDEENNNKDLHIDDNELTNENYPFSLTSPYHLMTLGVLFGMSPPAIETARILEIGCRGGENIIPHAVNYPEAKFVGVDPSIAHINLANKEIKELEVSNIEFHHLPMVNIDKKFGEFDYIICHGVLSQVNEKTRDKIFSICKDNLSPNGIAYVSYNTLPGWNTARTIKDMMLYHAKIFSDDQNKVTQSRLILDFVKDILSDSDSLHAKILEKEAVDLEQQSDIYLKQEYLSEDNVQYYFHQFIDKAAENKLQYLANANLPTMYLGNMAEKAIEKLQTINDIIRVEQYKDYINNVKYRMTLLCHDNIKLNRNINSSDISKFNMMLNVAPEKSLDTIDINSSEELKFFLIRDQKVTLSSSSPYLKALLYSFSENINNYVGFDKIIANANKKLGDKKLKELKVEFENNAMQLVLQGFLDISLQKERIIPNIEKPKISEFIRYQAAKLNSKWITNLNHQIVLINYFEKILIKYMDGHNTQDEIVEKLIEDIKSKRLDITIKRDDKPIKNIEDIKAELTEATQATVNKMTQYAILI